MPQYLGLVSVVVKDYDEAIAFYVGTLGFSLIEDTYTCTGQALGGCRAVRCARIQPLAGTRKQ